MNFHVSYPGRGTLHRNDLIKHTPADWDITFFRMAHAASLLSKDPRRQVGAVVVSADRRQVSPGYNGFPPSMKDTAGNLMDRDFCSEHMVHAEVNAIAQAGFTMTGGTLYATRFPCERCAQLILDSSISTVVAPKPDISHVRWGMSWARAAGMLSLKSIVIRFVPDDYQVQYNSLGHR